MCGVWLFFFKQKTAYELRISDWSSDVCSSDLIAVGVDGKQLQFRAGRIDDIAVGRRFERPVARIGDRLGRRIALHDEQAFADDRHVERLFARFVRALRELLGDAIEARALTRDRLRRLRRRRSEDVAELRLAALEADRTGVRSERRLVGKRWG